MQTAHKQPSHYTPTEEMCHNVLHVTTYPHPLQPSVVPYHHLSRHLEAYCCKGCRVLAILAMCISIAELYKLIEKNNTEMPALYNSYMSIFLEYAYLYTGLSGYFETESITDLTGMEYKHDLDHILCLIQFSEISNHIQRLRYYMIDVLSHNYVCFVIFCTV